MNSWSRLGAHRDGRIQVLAKDEGHPRLGQDGPAPGPTSTLEALLENTESERRLREVQRELAQANHLAAIGLLTASIAHEVRQPITATVINARAGARWLDARRPNLREARQALDRIIRDSGRADTVVDRVRALVKRAPRRRDRLQVNDLIPELVALTRGAASSSRIALETRLAADVPLVEGDRVQLQQVILNLMVNAVEAMSAVDGGARRLLIGTARADSGGALVAVGDSGPGLAPECRECIFDAFYTTKPDGLGLGLSICRSIIDAHGGRLWASANSPRGALFQFTLPAHLAQTAT